MITTIEQLTKIERKGRKIVFCNGCFDILHSGHIQFLKEAKAQGDLLVVGINSDSSVKKNKGPNRPINNEKDRAIVLDSLKMVDYVVIFDEPTPIPLITKLKPDVFVNGEDYGEACIEAPTVKSYGGRIHIVKNFGGISTTKLVKKILDSYGD
ncbi:MAG: D-glycero-beta-D-manno-heptose 1-phosphate adenylyltransferase [Nanoarchaeota archaeon]|nr:D-glycero-beta-D-manno-heptose 1-phosphate adenylyltransferase [Nanoarchaeota archaeon]MBU1704592.1 D-glycero-beta-D-manno-heptose 1-phosphate adenylyltransferase [Nanoarchaeota archaeon]